MNNDFFTVPDRRNTGSIKWNVPECSAPRGDVFPFSVADMEWRTPEPVRRACADAALNGFYCYTEPDFAYKKAVCAFMLRRHRWQIEPEWIVCTYGIVSALHTCVRSFTKKGEGVIIQTPVYHHFEDAILTNGRKAVFNSLKINNGRYEQDFADLEEKCRDKNNTMLILCSPHNPVGRVWTKEELTKTAEICLKNNVTIISDEIHFDITRNEHFILSSLDQKYQSITVTCTAASKSFNIAGLGTSQIIIPDENKRTLFTNRIKADGYDCINCFSYPALIAAYTQCDDWLDEMNKAVQSNFNLLSSYINKNMPEIKVFDLEGTYLVWLDVKCFNVPDEKAVEYFSTNAGIIPNNGGWFGKEGEGYIRLNIAVPQNVLTAALERLKKLYEKRWENKL